MPIYIIVEPDYESSCWCRDKIRGLDEELRRKRYKSILLNSIEDLRKHAKDINSEFSSLVTISSSQSWTDGVLAKASAYPIYPIVMCSQPYKSYNGGYSYVSLDLHKDMKTAVTYLKNNGKRHIAFFGIYSDSLHDACLEEAFFDFCKFEKSCLFKFKNSLSECLYGFVPRIEEFDAIICTNDIVAISLIQNLKDAGYTKLDRFIIISFSASLLLNLCAPQTTSLMVDFREFGKAAVSIHNALKNNSSFSAINVLIKSELKIGIKTQNKAYCRKIQLTEKKADCDFPDIFKEKHADKLIVLQNLLNLCDLIDFYIISGIMSEMTYSQINERYYISIDSIKYRIRKMIEFCNFPSRKELVNFFHTYLNEDSIKRITDSKTEKSDAMAEVMPADTKHK